MTTVTVHHLESSRSTRVLWLLEELGVPYQLKVYARQKPTLRAPPELKAVHPLGKSPVVDVDGAVLAESGAILEELVTRFGEGRLRPAAGTDEHRRYLHFLHFAEGSMMSPLMVSLLMGRVRKAKVPFFIKPITRRIADQLDNAWTRPEMNAHLAYLEAELKDRPYFAGDEFTAADIQMSYPLEAAVVRARLDERYPNLRAHMERTRARPAFSRALERGGPVMPERT